MTARDADPRDAEIAAREALEHCRSLFELMNRVGGQGYHMHDRIKVALDKIAAALAAAPLPTQPVREGMRVASDDGKNWRLEGPGWTMQPIGRVSIGEAEAICHTCAAALAAAPLPAERWEPPAARTCPRCGVLADGDNCVFCVNFFCPLPAAPTTEPGE